MSAVGQGMDEVWSWISRSSANQLDRKVQQVNSGNGVGKGRRSDG